MKRKATVSKSVYLPCEPPRTNAASTHMRCRFKEGLCSWCCSTSNGKYVFLAATVCVYGALWNKNSCQLLHSGLPLFPASRSAKSRWCKPSKWHLSARTGFAASSREDERGREAHSGTPTQLEASAPAAVRSSTLTRTHSLGVVLCASHAA